MKRISILSILLVAMGIFTYQFEELGGQKRKAKEEEKHKMIDEKSLGEMREIVAPKFHLKKTDRGFITSNGNGVDGLRLQKFLDILGRMKVRRYLSSEEYTPDKREKFFPEEGNILKFVFENGEVFFRLGKKLEFDQSFYMEVSQHGKARQMISFDSSPNEGTYDKSTFHKNPEKYLRFKTMILLEENFFIDTHLFQKEFLAQKVEWRSIKVDNIRNRAFKLDIHKRMTFPEPPRGMGTKEIAFRKYLEELVVFNGHKWLPAGELEDEVASLSIERKDGSMMNVKIYKKYNTESGNYAHLVEQNKILAFNAKAMAVFFRNSQDFWDLRAVPTDKPKEMKLAFPHEPEVDVEFKYGQVFEAISLRKIAGEAINTAFKSLVDTFASEADHLTSFEANDFAEEESLFTVSWSEDNNGDERVFHVILNGGELILANKNLGYKLHYQLDGMKGIGTKLKDFFLK